MRKENEFNACFQDLFDIPHAAHSVVNNDEYEHFLIAQREKEQR